MKTLRFLPVLFIGLGVLNCSENDDKIVIDSPVGEDGKARSYPIQDVTFSSIDGSLVNTAPPSPVVMCFTG